MGKSMAEQYKIVEALAPQTVADAVDGDYVSLKNALHCVIKLHITQGNAATIEIGVNEATTVAAGSEAAVAKSLKIWSNLDCAASDTMVERTAAATYTTDAGVKHKQVVIELEPAQLSDGFDCVCVTLGASNAANIVSAEYILTPRYTGLSAPSAILD